MTTSLLDVRRGSQTPRVSKYPPYALSAAPEFVDLARTARLTADEWQMYVLTHGLGMHRDGQWTARKNSVWVPRQNGKGAIIEVLELGWLFLTEEELVVHSAHQHRTSQKAYARLERLIRRTPDLHRRVAQYRQANGEQLIELHDGRMLQYTTRSRTAVRGFSASKLVLDEAQELTADQMAAILPTVSAMPNWQVWFFGTPPDDPAAWVYGLKEDGEAGAPRLGHFDWGMEGDPGDPANAARIKDPGTWYATNPALGGRIEIETVEDECKPSGLGDKFAQERCGAWKPGTAGGKWKVITRDAWIAACDPASVAVDPLVFCLEVAWNRGHAAIAAVGARRDGDLHVEVVEHAAGTAWAVPRLVQLVKRWKPARVVLDAGGPAGSLQADLVAALAEEKLTVEVCNPSYRESAQAFGMVYDAVMPQPPRPVGEESELAVEEQPAVVPVRLRYRPDRYGAVLTAAVESATKRPLGEGWAWERRTSVDMSTLGAVTGAVFGFVTRPVESAAGKTPLVAWR